LKKEAKEDAKSIIGKFLDNVLKSKIIGNIAWVGGIAPLSDIRDVALGYIIGETMARHSTWFVSHFTLFKPYKPS
jgi:hypothetical protein